MLFGGVADPLCEFSSDEIQISGARLYFSQRKSKPVPFAKKPANGTAPAGIHDEIWRNPV